jgi:phosphatidylglycerophosphatase A
VYGVLIAFALFRLFDVVKPWPISWFDSHMPGGLGIMFDDVVAGFMAMASLFAIDRWLMPVLV